ERQLLTAANPNGIAISLRALMDNVLVPACAARSVPVGVIVLGGRLGGNFFQQLACKTWPSHESGTTRGGFGRLRGRSGAGWPACPRRVVQKKSRVSRTRPGLRITRPR